MNRDVFLMLTALALVISGSAGAMGGKRESGAGEVTQLVAEGDKLYHQSCYKCHGPRAVSGGTIPDLRMFDGDEEAFVTVALEGRAGTIMPAWKEFLSTEEVKKIYAYVRNQPVEK